MDFKKLQYFLTVAEEGHITRAAKKLNIAQPPLSHQLKVLEEELGVKLIQKVGRNIQLTETGHALHTRGEQILELVNKATKELQDIHNGETGTLSIGCVAAWGATFLPEQIVSYSSRYPKIQFRIYEGERHKIIDLLTSGVIELGIMPSPFDTSIYESIQMPVEPVFIAMTKQWDDQPSSRHISLDEIVNKPLILHSNRGGRILSYFQEKNLEPHIICLHDDVRSMLLLASAGLGIAIVPESITLLKMNENLIYKEITKPSFTIGANIIWVGNRYLSTTSRNFLDIFIKE